MEGIRGGYTGRRREVWEKTGGIVEYRIFFGLCLTSKLCSTGIVTDWTRNSQTPREGDFGSDRDLNSLPPPHDSSTGGDSVFRL